MVARALSDADRNWHVDGYLERGSAVIDADICLLRFNLVDYGYAEGNEVATRIPVRYPSCILPEPFGDYPSTQAGSFFVPQVTVEGYFHQAHPEPSWWRRIFAQFGEQRPEFTHQPIALPHFDATRITCRDPGGKFEFCTPSPCPVSSFLVPQPIPPIHRPVHTRP